MCTGKAMMLAGVAVALICSPTHADFVNGSFESGLAGWTATPGYTAVVTSEADKGPVSSGNWVATQGSYFALLTAGAPLDYKLLSQPFAASAGDWVSFDIFFNGGDYWPYNDDGYARLLDTQNGTAVVLYAQSIASVGDYGSDGWRHVSHQFDQSGSYQLEFGIRNVGPGLASTLGVDNVALAVPLPAAAFAGLALLGGVGVSRRLGRRS